MDETIAKLEYKMACTAGSALDSLEMVNGDLQQISGRRSKALDQMIETEKSTSATDLSEDEKAVINVTNVALKGDCPDEGNALKSTTTPLPKLPTNWEDMKVGEDYQYLVYDRKTGRFKKKRTMRL